MSLNLKYNGFPKCLLQVLYVLTTVCGTRIGSASNEHRFPLACEFFENYFLKIKSQFYNIVETEEKNICLDKLILQLIVEKYN